MRIKSCGERRECLADENWKTGTYRALFAAFGGKDAWAAPGAVLDDGFFPARPGDFALCGARPEALPLDSATFEKVDETFILRFALSCFTATAP